MIQVISQPTIEIKESGIGLKFWSSEYQEVCLPYRIQAERGLQVFMLR